MLRRLIVAGLAAAFAAPLLAIAPTSAAVLFSCTTVAGNATLTPGLGHTPQAQTDVDSTATMSGCSNGATGSLVSGGGSFAGALATTTFPPRPLACPRAIAGDDGHQGPEFADQTPVLLSGDPGFEINWGGTSTEPNTKGIVKVKSNGPANPGTVRIVLVRSTGGYPPGPGTTKTKVKGRLNFVPTGSFDCSHAAGNSNEIDTVTLANNGSFIVQTA